MQANSTTAEAAKGATRDKVTYVSASKREVGRKVMSKKGEAQRLGAPKVRKGWNQVHNLSREQLNNTPLSAQELAGQHVSTQGRAEVWTV